VIFVIRFGAGYKMHKYIGKDLWAYEFAYEVCVRL
jgi:hypothetical protein